MLNGTMLGKHSFTDIGSVGVAATRVIASATTIAPTSKITRITGNTTIDTITVPTAYFVGPIYVYNTDASVGTISTSGNVQLGVTLTRYKVFLLIYDPSTSKWYPSAVS